MDTLKPNILISAIKDDKPVFLAIDISSGGYPYWTTNVSSACIYMDNLDAYDNWKRDQKYLHGATNVEIVEMTLKFKTVESLVAYDDREDRIEAALKKLTEDEKVLLGLK